MAKYISKKSLWLRCLVSFLSAAGTAVLLCLFFDGPRLGPFYDFLLRRRPATPISGELLIIDSSLPGQELGNDILEPGAATSLLYTMAELGARTLIIQVPILGLSAGGTVGEEEILYRFDEEFSILTRNIRNLFDAIRTGSVAPAESARFVGELVELSEKGKDRLVSALVRRDEEGVVSMEKAAAIFGHARRPGDLRVQLIRAGESGRPGVLAESGEYSRARPDRDGTLRRIAPVLTVFELSEGKARGKNLEHIIYGALKTRYRASEIEYTDSWGMQFLVKKDERVLYPAILALLNGPGGMNTLIPLDKTGAVLFEAPHRGGDFRRIGISDFLSYDETDRALRRLLSDGEGLGIYRDIEGEDHPGILYDYALSLREELAALTTEESSQNDRDLSPPEEKKLVWIEARNRYFESLEDFLYGPAEMNLVRGYEEIIGSGSLDEAGVTSMTEMRDALIRSFAALRDRHSEVLELREKLESNLSFSFCILGNTLDVEASALLANSILTGRAVKPGEDRFLLLGSLLSLLLVCFFVKSPGPASTLGIGALITLFIGTGFSLGFIFSGIWLNPLVPLASGSVGFLVSFVWAAIARGRFSRRFRLAYGPYVSPSCLMSVIRAGKPLPSQAVTALSAVVAIKNSDPAALKDSMNPRDPAIRVVLDFQEKVSAVVRKAGGTITGTEGDLVTACFGSPLERVFLAEQQGAFPYNNDIFANVTPALRAVDCVSEIARHPDYGSWHFGMDLGICSFAWTALSGYSAFGAPVQRARILSRMAGRYKARIVVSVSVNEALSDLPVKKLDVLKGSHGEEPFYRLMIGKGC